MTRILSIAHNCVISRQLRRGLAVAATVAMMPLATLAEPSHGISMYGKTALPEGFTHLPYVNPEAPKGGTMRIAEPGSFDSLKPFVLKGNAVWNIPTHTLETLMFRSIDEPFALYGLLASGIETGPYREWVEFTLRPEAEFSDGSPVTIDDVMWTFETLGTQGHPRYQRAWSKVASMEQTGPQKVRFTFTDEADREMALLMGMRPILQRAQYESQDFAASSLEAPIGSGPYVVSDVDPGRSVTFTRNPDYWGADLAINVGRNNLDTIRYDYFGDMSAMFQAFKAGDIDVWRELNAHKWATEYDFPAAQAGEVVQSEIPHHRPSGIQGLVMNTRNPLFADWRVRQAMLEAFNFEFLNKTLSGGADQRISSYFSNSPLAMDHGPAQGDVLALLEPYRDTLLPGTIEGYSLPEGSADSPANRSSMRRALKLLGEAGWTVQDGVLKNEDGQPFAFEILLNQSGTSMRGSSEMQQIVDIYAENLKQLGMHPEVTLLDAAQFVERTNSYQFDMTWYERSVSLSPGNEQRLYWGANGVTQPGTRNWMGMNTPVIDVIVDEMVQAEDAGKFTSAVRALDRVLTAGRYVIPVGFSPASHVAHDASLQYPEHLPLYGDWPGFMPETWWSTAAQK